jgi:hypothetical protein
MTLCSLLSEPFVFGSVEVPPEVQITTAAASLGGVELQVKYYRHANTKRSSVLSYGLPITRQYRVGLNAVPSPLLVPPPAVHMTWELMSRMHQTSLDVVYKPPCQFPAMAATASSVASLDVAATTSQKSSAPASAAFMAVADFEATLHRHARMNCSGAPLRRFVCHQAVWSWAESPKHPFSN